MENLKSKIINYFPKYKLKTELPIMPDERLPIPSTIFLSFQHVLAMFGGNIIAPLLMGFSTNAALFFSGIGTLIFYVVTGGKVPSYLGSSFTFIAVVNSASGYVFKPGTSNPFIAEASGAIMVTGFIYMGISFLVILAGTKWIEVLTPPVVTGSVVLSIGLNLATSAVNQASSSGFDAWMAFLTAMVTILATCYAPGQLKRLPVLIGGLTGYLVYLFLGLGGIGPGINFDAVKDSSFVGLPPTTLPKFNGTYISLIAPVSVILAAENIGHLKAVGSMTGMNFDNMLGRTFLGDSIACIIAGFFGSIGTTTYSENLGVMNITKIFSTLSFVFSAIIAIVLGLLPIFGNLVSTIPDGVFGGLEVVLFGITALTGAELWIQAQVDFSKPRNLLTAAVSVVLGCGMINTEVQWGNIKIDGVGCATFSAIFLYQLLREDWGDLFRKVWFKLTNKRILEPTDDDSNIQYNKSQLLKPLLDQENTVEEYL